MAGLRFPNASLGADDTFERHTDRVRWGSRQSELDFDKLACESETLSMRQLLFGRETALGSALGTVNGAVGSICSAIATARAGAIALFG